MSFPLLFTVGLRVWSGNGVDSGWGNTVDVWAPPVAKQVYGWSAPNGRQVGSEPKVAGHDRVVVETELLVPIGFTCAPKDRIILDFDSNNWSADAKQPEHEVLGEIEDYGHGPFGFNPGGVVNLSRVTG